VRLEEDVRRRPFFHGLTMIDRHYGHLAPGRGVSTRSACPPPEPRRTSTVDAAWTLKPAAAATRDNENGG
jgi:hypothetical protein